MEYSFFLFFLETQAHPDGQAIRRFRTKQEALRSLRRQRARTLMNADKDRQKERDARAKAAAAAAPGGNAAGTAGAGTAGTAAGTAGNSGEVHDKAMSEYIRTKDMMEVRRLEKELVGQHHGKHEALIGMEVATAGGNRPTLGAFVVFKHEESYAACLQE